MSKKIVKNNINPEKPARNVSVLFQRSFEHYREMHAENLAQSMIKNVRDDEKILSIEALLNKEEIEWEEWDRLKDKYPVLKRADNIIKQTLTARRDYGAIVRDFDASYVARYMPLYSKKIKELEEWRAQLSKQEEQKPTTVIVKMEPFNKEPESINE